MATRHFCDICDQNITDVDKYSLNITHLDENHYSWRSAKLMHNGKQLPDNYALGHVCRDCVAHVSEVIKEREKR